MILTKKDVARMIDFSIVRPEVDERELAAFAAEVMRYRFIGAHVLPYYVRNLKERIAGADDVLVGTGIGFPFGSHRTEVKVTEAKLALKDGCGELDMVINIGALLSGHDDYVLQDVRAVVEAAGGKTVKVILEVHYLDDEAIRRGCELCIRGGASFVKTATGHAPSGATRERIALIKSIVGDRVQIKASGGVRDLKTLTDMYRLGAIRFGIGMASALGIMREMESMPGESVTIEN